VGADPAVKGGEMTGNLCGNLITLSGESASADAGRTGQRGLTQKSWRGNRQDGPATRPKTPLAVENSVGELAANHRVGRQMPV